MQHKLATPSNRRRSGPTSRPAKIVLDHGHHPAASGFTIACAASSSERSSGTGMTRSAGLTMSSRHEPLIQKDHARARRGTRNT